MDEILKTLYVKLDSTMQSLSKTAMSQILIKIVYSYSPKHITLNDVIERYKSITSIKKIDKNTLDSLLANLVSCDEIKKAKGLYYISQSKKSKIDKAQSESLERERLIIEKYFHPTHSDYSIIQKWFRDVMIFFFNDFSDEWVSSLCYRNDSISTRIESVLEMIKRRTQNNKSLDKNDIEILPEYFRTFISSIDTNIDALLWEYGTSSFAAKLIKKSSDLDKLTIDTFNGAKCILDTNILMNLGLESSSYYESIKTLETAFINLGIEVGVLNITKDEYKRTVANKRREILNLVQKNSSNMIELFKDIDDQYAQTAIKRQFKCLEDFENFFDHLLDIPIFVHDKLRISLYDDDIELEKAIDIAQADENKRKELNSYYRNYRQKDKNENALLHDVGLIYGANYLRNHGKYFILSQDSSVNMYARNKPFMQDLPMAMRIETIINVLALNSNSISSEDYISLFANLIREGLQPNKESFKLEDLSFILEKDEQIANLPPEKSRQIVQKVHKKRLLGDNEEDIFLEMNRELQHAKWEIVDELDKTKDKLYIKDRENSNLKSNNQQLSSALKNAWNREAEDKFNKEHYHIIYKTLLKVILGFILLLVILYYLNAFVLMIDSSSVIGKYILPFSIDAVLSAIYSYFKVLPNIYQHKKSKADFISEYIHHKKNE